MASNQGAVDQAKKFQSEAKARLEQQNAKLKEKGQQIKASLDAEGQKIKAKAAQAKADAQKRVSDVKEDLS